MPRKRKDSGKAERVKLYQLMDCDPYRLDEPDRPAVVLRLAHKDELQPPMALTPWDARRLAEHLVIALATHGDKWAEGVLAMRDEQHEYPSWFEQGDPYVGKLPPRK